MSNDLEQSRSVQRRMVYEMNQMSGGKLGWNHPIAFIRYLGRPGTLGELFDAHAIRLWILEEKEQAP